MAEALKLCPIFANEKEKRILRPLVESKLHLIEDMTGRERQKAIDTARTVAST